MLTGELHVEQLALAVVGDLISWFNLVQECFYLSESLAAGVVLRIGINDPPGRGKFLCEFAAKKRVVLGCLGHNFGIWLRSVQGSEPTFKGQAPSKPEFMQPCHGLGEWHIEICYDSEILLRARYLVQQKTSEGDGEQQQDYREAKNLCCYILPERHRRFTRIS